MGVLLFFIAKALRGIAIPFVFAYNLYNELKAALTISNLKMIDNKFLFKAIQEDKYCCHEDAELLNALFLTKDAAHKFGNIKETISSVLGKNFLAGTLKHRGLEIYYLLDNIQINHCLISIDNSIN